MVCVGNCVLAGALLGGFGLTSVLSMQAERRGSPFKASLTAPQAQKYEEIVAMRRRLANHGFLLGALLALGYVLYQKFISGTEGGASAATLICNAVAITLATTYFYYVLSPKSDWMIRYLNPTATVATNGGAQISQTDLYLEKKRAYQLRWTGGLLLGGAAAYFLGQGLKKV